MLLVETYISESEIHGLGLFAGQDITQDTVTWKFHPAIDLLITQDEFDKLPSIAQAFITECASLSRLTGKYVLSADNARFTNHSSTPNLDSAVVQGEPEAIAIANRDIKKGEEMTIDYRKFDTISGENESEYLRQ